MTIPFHRNGFALPVAPALIALLNQEAATIGLNLERLTQLTFNFRSPTYSPEQGGAHPVEIRLIRGLDGWLFDYVTDFSYQGPGHDAELCKEIDFNFLDGEHTMLGWGPLRLAEARDLFDIWQSTFIAYGRLECFSVTVAAD